MKRETYKKKIIEIMSNQDLTKSEKSYLKYKLKKKRKGGSVKTVSGGLPSLGKKRWKKLLQTIQLCHGGVDLGNTIKLGKIKYGCWRISKK